MAIALRNRWRRHLLAEDLKASARRPAEGSRTFPELVAFVTHRRKSSPRIF